MVLFPVCYLTRPLTRWYHEWGILSPMGGHFAHNMGQNGSEGYFFLSWSSALDGIFGSIM